VLFSGAILFSKNTEITNTILEKLKEVKVKTVKVFEEEETPEIPEIHEKKSEDPMSKLKKLYLDLTDENEANGVIYILRQLTQSNHPELLELIKAGFKKFSDPKIINELVIQCKKLQLDNEIYEIIYNLLFSEEKQLVLSSIFLIEKFPDINKNTLYLLKLLSNTTDADIMSQILNYFKSVESEKLNLLILKFSQAALSDKGIKTGIDILKKLLKIEPVKPEQKVLKVKTPSEVQPVIKITDKIIPDYCKESNCEKVTYYIPKEIKAADVNEAKKLFIENYTEANAQIESIYTEIANNENPDIDKIKNITSGFIDQVLYNRNLVARLRNVFTGDNYLFSHSLNVCILSVLTGLFLDYNPNKIAELGISAMLADVGMMNVPGKIWEESRILTPEEKEIVGVHIFEGFDLLHSTEDLKDIIATVSLQHHERLDGSGYLNHGDKQMVDYARIVAICDVYDALTSPRVYRKPYSVQAAMRYLIANTPKKFDRKMMKAFIRHVGFLPIGTKVLLSNGIKATIAGTNREQWSKPRVFFDSEPEKEVDLALIKDVYIKEVLQDDAVDFEDWDSI
ncbi:MAG: HD domain-containing phosphohydrolase, partial [Candidatus Muiribacteriota bacterium]